jgi:hypothetical protein
MVQLLAGLLVALLAALLAGALSGRIKATSCCSPADPRRDLRMRAAFEDDPAEAPPAD